VAACLVSIARVCTPYWWLLLVPLLFSHILAS
jgi:hypothetical protein